jgi:hypothetical protein
VRRAVFGGSFRTGGTVGLTQVPTAACNGIARSREQHTDAAKNVKAWALVQQWIEDAKKCEIPELKAFAVMLFQDMEAMVAAIVMPAGKARQRAG